MDVDFGGGEEENEFAELGEKEDEEELQDKDCMLFLIDAQPAMMQPCESAVAGGETGPPPFEQALSCVAACMRDRILAGDQDVIGVVLFGTEHAAGAFGQQPFPHTFVLQEPEVPSAMAIHKLQQLLLTHKFDKFGHLPESSKSSFELSNLFWLISMIFNSSPKAKGCRRRVLLITNDDDPAMGCSARRERAMNRAHDLQAARIWIDPFFFGSPSHGFDLSEESFWRVLLGQLRQNHPRAATDESAEELRYLSELDRSSSWLSNCLCETEASLLSRLRRAQHRRRAMGSLELRLGTEGAPSLPVKLVSVVKPFTKPAATKLHAASNEPLLQDRTIYCKTHGTLLQPSDIWKAFDFGGKWLYIERYELSEMCKQLGPKGLQLVGFKSHDRLKFYHNVQPSVFLEPDPKQEGSINAFTALVMAMQAKRRIAICKYRRSEQMGGMRLVALLPQLRETEPNSQVTSLPCGLHMIFLPWADELRQLSLPPPLSLSAFQEEQLEATRTFVHELTMADEESLLLPNPAAQRYMSVVESLALPCLALTETTETTDQTLPDSRRFEGSGSAAAKVFAAAFGFEQPAAAEPAAKRAKVGAPQSLGEWLELLQGDAIGSLTMPPLKAYLKEHEQPLSGKKDELVARVQAHLRQRVAEGGTYVAKAEDNGADEDMPKEQAGGPRTRADEPQFKQEAEANF